MCSGIHIQILFGIDASVTLERHQYFINFKQSYCWKLKRKKKKPDNGYCLLDLFWVYEFFEQNPKCIQGDSQIISAFLQIQCSISKQTGGKISP